jgi:hypothetical protein
MRECFYLFRQDDGRCGRNALGFVLPKRVSVSEKGKRDVSQEAFSPCRAFAAPMGVQQKLMRHAHVSTTTDQYGNASALAKRKADRPIVQRLLRRSATQQISIQ